METIKIEVKFNNKLIQTINLDADVLLKEFHKSHHTESEQTDVSKVKAISMTDWISIKSFITDNNIELTKQESGVLKYYIKHKDVSKKASKGFNDSVKQGSEYRFYTSNSFLIYPG